MLTSFANGKVFRNHVIDVHLKAGETFHLSLLSDLHIDSSSCDYEGLKRLADERRRLPNHSAIAIGDICDLVMPGDIKRYRPTARVRDLDGRDDYLTAAIEHVIEKMKTLDLKWDLISPGNHEDSSMRWHGVDATSVLAHALGARRGGYWGFINYRLLYGNRNSRGDYHTMRFRVAYHHGAWGGQDSKGMIGAKKFASVLDGWNVFAFGHNHNSRCDPELRIDVDPKTGELKEREVYIINCSSWTESYSKDARYPSYKEIRGYPVSGPRKSPLIRVTPRWLGRDGRGPKATGRLTMDVRIEI